ncbi:probable methyltransferase-like protein 25 [Hydractinia symbiolongicarpus]|uniref:probable methyltransferase-like protein 25 n=1 Tax=Hydractinia symbiolongicarpus TaxID=13093 RepID=UPI00254B5E9D|nr:probable methyltransferase-like protein 25 [Hydractinia symbiolongicarpus]
MATNKDEWLKKLYEDIEQLTNFLRKHWKLINLHMNDFIIDNLWDIYLDVTAESSEEDFIATCNHLGFIGCCYSNQKCCVQQCLGGNNNTKISHETASSSLNTFTSEKKYYEVQKLAPSIYKTANRILCNQVVDLGSGKGYLGEYLAAEYHVNVLGVEGSSNHTTSAHSMHTKMIKAGKRMKENEFFKTVVSSVSSETIEGSDDFVKLLCQHLRQHDSASEELQGAVLTGLHACGDLTSTAIKLFMKEEYFQALHIVGCCYNLITDHQETGFPMSKYLNNQDFKLGKNAKMLACQCPERWKATSQTLGESLLYRAILEKILQDKDIKREVLTDVRFRSVGRKSNSFQAYIKNVAKKLNPPELKITEEEVDEYLSMYKNVWEKMKRYHWLRMQLAPCIEKLILLDRLCCLVESGFASASIIQIFSSVISPRCYALVCMKS